MTIIRKFPVPAKILISLSATKAEGVAELERLLVRARDMYSINGRFLRVNVYKTYPAATQLLEKNGVSIDPGVERIDDAVFDLLFEILGEVSPKSPVLKKTSSVVDNKTKTKLPYAMNGLTQVRPDTVDTWLSKHTGPYVVSDKLDGVSFEQVCSPSGVAEAFTKGDSDMGNRISRLIPHMNVPQSVKADIAIRAEMIMKPATFHARHSKESGIGAGKKYENARNMVAGATSPKRRDLHPALKDIDVVAYELLKPRLKPSDQFKKLKQLGYTVAPHKVYKTLDSATLVKLLAERKASSSYELDGLVIAQDKVYPIATSDEAQHAVKFKYNLDDAGVQVKVLAVVWGVSKNGRMIPRINIPPTRIGGVTIDFCTGHNAYFVQHGFSKKDEKLGLPLRPIGPGAIIKVVRSGEVIPYVTEVVRGAKTPSMPTSAYKLGAANKAGASVHIMHEGQSDLSEVKKITYFFSKLDVEGLKQGTVQKLFDHGLNTILKIVKATKAQIMAADGIQERTATKLQTNMKEALAKMTLPALMDASGLFGTGMGEKRITLIFKVMPDLMERPLPGLAEEIESNVRGFSSTLARQFVAGLPKFKVWYAKLGIIAQSVKAVKPKGSAFKNETVVWTGFRNAAQELKVAEQGGTVGSGVSSRTTMLIIKDASFNSSKVAKAREIGAKVLTNAEFQAVIDKIR